MIIKGVMRETGFPGAAVVKALLASAGDTGDTSSIPGPRGSPEGGNGNSNILAWRIPWTEEAGGLQSIGSQRVGHN